MQKEGRLSLWHRTVQLPDVHRRGAHGHRRRYTRQRRTAGMRPCAESADRHRQLLKPTVQDVSCAESADRHRQLLKLAVQDVYVRQHARSAPTQISAQYTPNQAYAPTVYAHPRTDDQPRTPWYPQAQCAMPYATGRDRTRRVPSSGRVSARIRTQADTKGINITWEIC